MLSQLLGVRLHTIAIFALDHVRTELYNLLVIPSRSPHPSHSLHRRDKRSWRSGRSISHGIIALRASGNNTTPSVNSPDPKESHKQRRPGRLPRLRSQI
jgi:hypothetical protein